MSTAHAGIESIHWNHVQCRRTVVVMNDSTTQLGASSTSTDALLSGPPQQLAIFGATRGIGWMPAVLACFQTR